jgi:RNA polymerase sigma-54 factor
MGLEIKQSLRLSQQLVMTPQLQQAIKLLQLSRLELQELIAAEMIENPVLEEAPEDTSTPEAALPETPEPVVDKMEGQDDFNWEAYVAEYNAQSHTATSGKEALDELPTVDQVLTRTTSLEEHLHWQMSMLRLTDQERAFGELIIGNLNDDGYLTTEVEACALEVGLDLEDAGALHKMIREFDPVGVASRNLQECLLTQAELLQPRNPLVERILQECFTELEKKQNQGMVKKLHSTLQEVQAALHLLTHLEPRPGRSFQRPDTHYILPDITVTKIGDKWTILMNDDGIPRLRISSYYRNLLKADASKDQPAVTKDYVQDKLRGALWLIRSIHNRQKTIYKVTETILQRQRDFFEKGVQHLKPMVLRDIASDIGMHESTISRVTTNKFVYTPYGIFELKYFFNSSIQATDGGDSLAGEAVKDRIRQLIAKEDPKTPLSDQQIVLLLEKENITIARRTVAKYREALGILTSVRRKKFV